MIKTLNNKSLSYGIPGFLIHGVFLFINPLIALLGGVLLMIGLGYYAKAKGHSGWFGLFGILGLIGVIVLLALNDKNKTPEEIASTKKTKPNDVILGIILGLAIPAIIIILAVLLHKKSP